MRPFASYEITLRGTLLDVKEAIDCIADAVRDQHDALPNLFDKYSPNVDDDDDDNVVPSDIEETIAIWQTHDCVWLEDLEALAADIASFAPNLIFSISGHIEDPSDSAEDEMDFKSVTITENCFRNQRIGIGLFIWTTSQITTPSVTKSVICTVIQDTPKRTILVSEQVPMNGTFWTGGMANFQPKHLCRIPCE